MRPHRCPPLSAIPVGAGVTRLAPKLLRFLSYLLFKIIFVLAPSVPFRGQFKRSVWRITQPGRGCFPTWRPWRLGGSYSSLSFPPFPPFAPVQNQLNPSRSRGNEAYPKPSSLSSVQDHFCSCAFCAFSRPIQTICLANHATRSRMFSGLASLAPWRFIFVPGLLRCSICAPVGRGCRARLPTRGKFGLCKPFNACKMPGKMLNAMLRPERPFFYMIPFPPENYQSLELSRLGS